MATSIIHIAKYILEQQGEMTHMKLQKLCYYAQAWGLVWDEKPLVNGQFEAWANGPVHPNLYQRLKGLYRVSESDLPQGDPSKLSEQQKETVDAVLEFYGDKSSQWLSDLTHMEDPWKCARNELSPGERGSEEITRSLMAEYYGAL